MTDVIAEHIPNAELRRHTPMAWRWLIGSGVLALGLGAYACQDVLGMRGRAGVGIICFLGLIAMLSNNLRAINWRTILGGMGLQLCLALFILRTEAGFSLFNSIASGTAKFLEFSGAGAKFVFGLLADPAKVESVFGQGTGFLFAFAALPTIIFVSSFFTVLYYFGVLQMIVRVLAKIMMRLMGTSGAESLSAAANVFMGQTEAPLIVKPFVRQMTQSELLAMMVGGMATISGALMAIYIQMGANAVAILATSVMAAPCGLYLSKILYPEEEEPVTRGQVKTEVEIPHRNVIDAAAAGASDGLSLALNVAAMLIAFLGILALVDYLLKLFPAGRSLGDVLTLSPSSMLAMTLLLLIGYLAAVGVVRRTINLLASMRQRDVPTAPPGLWWAGIPVYLALVELALRTFPPQLSLSLIFSSVFAPMAFLMGVPTDDIGSIANLLGIKLVSNEFVAYTELTSYHRGELPALLWQDISHVGNLMGVSWQPGTFISSRGFMLATFALTGFANFGSIGIQLGGIGAMAPERRGDLAKMGVRALIVGFMTTVVNASLAGILIRD